ncbi:MAG: DUF3047 domain-containing protein, partial [Burkholderiales bacterium]|nr:DUF3047 domain-containing protein [Burkholderiales bacterium]
MSDYDVVGERTGVEQMGLLARSTIILGLLAGVGCAQLITPYPTQMGSTVVFDAVQPFSLTSVGEIAPPAWEPWVLSRFLARTRYRIVEHEGERVLEADANVSASGLLQPLTLAASED